MIRKIPLEITRRSPFIATATYPDGLSRTEFRRLRRADKLQAMIEWFQANYEDPVHEMPYDGREGGYQYIRGGPFEARDELDAMFGGIVPEQMIEEAIDEVESDGTLQWTPTDKGPELEDWEDIDGEVKEREPISTLPSLEDIPNEPGVSYGRAEDHEARTKVRAALSEVQINLPTRSNIGIGHNNPPEPLEWEQSAEVKALPSAVKKLNEEFDKKEPSIGRVKKLASFLKAALSAISSWTKGKFEVMAEEAAKTTGKVVAAAGLFALFQIDLTTILNKAYSTIVDWLQLVTLPF